MLAHKFFRKKNRNFFFKFFFRLIFSWNVPNFFFFWKNFRFAFRGKTAKILDPKLPKVTTPPPPKTAHQKIFWPSHEKVAKKPPTSFYLIFHLPVSVRKVLGHFPEKSAVHQIEGGLLTNKGGARSGGSHFFWTVQIVDILLDFWPICTQKWKVTW